VPYRFTFRAEDDLEGILAYSRDEWGPDQAVRYRDQLLRCCNLIAGEPWVGTSYNDLRAGYFRIHEGRHMLFFKRDERGVLVVRILHDRMDPSLHLAESDEEEAEDTEPW
jgi:toxin ParE1/3/4